MRLDPALPLGPSLEFPSIYLANNLERDNPLTSLQGEGTGAAVVVESVQIMMSETARSDGFGICILGPVFCQLMSYIVFFLKRSVECIRVCLLPI